MKLSIAKMFGPYPVVRKHGRGNTGLEEMKINANIRNAVPRLQNALATARIERVGYCGGIHELENRRRDKLVRDHLQVAELVDARGEPGHTAGR